MAILQMTTFGELAIGARGWGKKHGISLCTHSPRVMHPEDSWISYSHVQSLAPFQQLLSNWSISLRSSPSPPGP